MFFQLTLFFLAALLNTRGENLVTRVVGGVKLFCNFFKRDFRLDDVLLEGMGVAFIVSIATFKIYGNE